jgi:hypothetical protein
MALGALSGCGIADHFQAESRMNQSQEAYRKRLLETPRSRSCVIRSKLSMSEIRLISKSNPVMNPNCDSRTPTN